MGFVKHFTFISTLLLLLLITYAATFSKYWIHWLSVTVTVFMLYVATLIFFGGSENTFAFDPFQDVSKM